LATIISVNGEIGGIYWGYNPYGKNENFWVFQNFKILKLGSLGYYNPYQRPYAGGYGYSGYVSNGYGYGRPYRPYRYLYQINKLSTIKKLNQIISIVFFQRIWYWNRYLNWLSDRLMFVFHLLLYTDWDKVKSLSNNWIMFYA
jgi:hypothetical protein